MNRTLLRIEGAMVFAGCLYFYTRIDLEWWIFLALLLLPDISMLGYASSKKAGAYSYNFFHTYLVPGALLVIGNVMKDELTMGIGLIWLAHIGMDRAIGYGLKYETSFKETHIQKV